MTALNISFGAMAPPLIEQLSEFGIKQSEELEHIQKDIDAINRVRIRGIIPRSKAIKGEQKLFKKITTIVQKFVDYKR